MYYCQWCGYDAGWPVSNNLKFIDKGPCCLCGKEGGCISASYKWIKNNKKELTPIQNNDINKALTNLFLKE